MDLKDLEQGIRQRVLMAMGSKGNFGVEPMDSHAAGEKPVHGSATLKDHERGARSPIGGNQANADHGPHGNHE